MINILDDSQLTLNYMVKIKTTQFVIQLQIRKEIILFSKAEYFFECFCHFVIRIIIVTDKEYVQVYFFQVIGIIF